MSGGSAQPAEGMVVADRFRLARPLGQGGMGSVWLAQQLSLDTPCALKFLHAEAAASADLRARFEREAKAAAQLRSPNVVQILEHGVWQGVPYIAMELLEGEDLDHRLRRARTLGAHETAAIIAQVARALGRAHAAGLVHRDLKPGNVFLVRDDDREVAKVLDFGIAKRTQLDVGDANTKTGSVLGTPHYMSPEQARGTKEVDHRTDLWALGVLTYRCLVGKLPFQGAALGDLFMKIMAEPIPVPSQHAPVPPGFDLWWAHAVARDPDQRFQSAKEMADALGPALGLSGAPIDASASYTAGRQVSLPDHVPAGPVAPMPTMPMPTPMHANVAAAAVSPPAASTVTAVMSQTRSGSEARTGVLVVAGVLALVSALVGTVVVVLRARSAADLTAPAAPATAPAAPTIAEVPASASAAPVVPAVPAPASAVPSVSAAPRPSPPPSASATSTAVRPPAAKLPATPPKKRHDDGI